MQSLTEIERILQSIPAEDGFPSFVLQDRMIIFRGITAFKKTINSISRLDAFSAEVSRIKASSLYSTTNDTLAVSEAQGAKAIRDDVVFLENCTSALKRVIPRLVQEEPAESVYIRFPDTESIPTITTDLLTIEKAVLQIIANNHIDGQFRVTRWESGSLWIHVAVGTSTAVTLIAGAAWSATVVAKKWMEVQIFNEHARGLAIKNESLNDLRDAQKQMLHDLVSAEAQALADKHFDTSSNPEIVERMRFTIQTFSELIRRGGEVSPALNAPESVENLFPDYKGLPTIQSQIKRIEDTGI